MREKSDVRWSTLEEIRRGVSGVPGSRFIPTLRKVGERVLFFLSTGIYPGPMSSTEIGNVSEVMPKEVGKEWGWFRFSSSIKPHFVPDGHGAYELVIEVRHRSTLCYAVIFGWIADICTPSPPRLVVSASTTLK